MLVKISEGQDQDQQWFDIQDENGSEMIQNQCYLKIQLKNEI